MSLNLAHCVTLAACVILARAQLRDAALHANGVILNVTALDSRGHPVADLTSAEFQIFDEGRVRPIASFRASAAPPTTVIFFDLLNSIPDHREYISNLIIRALEPLETGDSVGLYLLANYGEIYPVHALPTPLPGARSAEENGQPAQAPWTRKIHPLLDWAIQNVYGRRPMDDRDVGIRTGTTFLKLGELGELLTKIPGPKTVIWITAGVPTWLDSPYGCHDVTFPDGSESYLAGKCGSDCTTISKLSKCMDYTPFLRHFIAELGRTGTIIHSVQETFPGSIPPADRGTPKDTLQELADLTGGRVYSDGEVAKAIAQSLANARAHYQLTYDAPPPDGKYHKLRVACTRKGVRIEAQRGYFADQP